MNRPDTVALNVTSIGGAMPLSLEELIQFAAKQMELRFKHVGRIYPMWHAESLTDSYVISADMRDKDLTTAALAAFFRERNVVRFVFMDEAWIVDRKPGEIDKLMREGGVSAQPDRKEIVMIHAEDVHTSKVYTRQIIRPKKGKARLGPLETDAEFGTMIDSRWSVLLAHLRKETRH